MTENDVINKVISMIKEGKSLVGQSGKIAIKALEKVQREYKGMILDNNWWTTFRGSFETEDEVFEFIFDRMDTSDFEDSYIDAGGHGDCNESVKITAEEKRDFIFEFMMKILDEVQQYRAIETELKEKYNANVDILTIMRHFIDTIFKGEKHEGFCILTNEDRDAWDAYCAIGTVEECREATEKQKAKRPLDRCMFCECPTCGNVEILHCAYCPDCGQKLDWNNDEVTDMENIEVRR